MASTPASSSSKALLPQLMQADDEPTAVEPARRKANTQKTSLFPLLSRPRKRSSKKLKRVSSTEDGSRTSSSSSLFPVSSTGPPPANPLTVDEWPLTASMQVDVLAIPEPNTQIELQGFSNPLEDDSKDVYRWAVVYENQRG